MFLDKKTLLQIWLNPGLKLTIFRGPGPRYLSSTDKDWNAVPGIRNPRRGIQNPRLSWIPLYGATDSQNYVKEQNSKKLVTILNIMY